MPDITITWDPINFRGDWTVESGQVATGGDLETSVLICLFTDRVLPADTAPPDGTTDHRGWWADTYEALPIGSRLWTLARRSISDVTQLLRDARDICQEALAPLVSDGVAKQVDVQTSYPAPGRLGIAVTVTKPDGTLANFQYQWAWSGVLT
ncbi:phage GP46 family protein [Acidocella sp.]|uniref:phage GP46 family protein n=1 Tax=Acidocella sp. TaxID=50710 RepID=UPI0026255901|nr:phage GP46 family protein [Acidocella sp.]